VYMLLSDQHKFFKNLITILLSIVEHIVGVLLCNSIP
jgi:hypothetical protein